MVENPFASDAAANYHRFRPYHHERTLRRAFRLATPAEGPALDVACGTGLSTVALHRLGVHAVGLDVSLPMLHVAYRVSGVPIVQAKAEALPVPDGTCALITCGSGVHWLDHQQFWNEARRAVRPGALIVVYDHGFMGEAEDLPEFSSWYQGSYMTKYPAPPRNHPSTDATEPVGFACLGNEAFTERIQLDHDHLVGYLLTQSNTIVAPARGEESHEQIAAWLTAETVPFFVDSNQPIEFGYWGQVQCFTGT
jgi:SAM-dependent methyltransferase